MVQKLIFTFDHALPNVKFFNSMVHSGGLTVFHSFRQNQQLGKTKNTADQSSMIYGGPRDPIPNLQMLFLRRGEDEVWVTFSITLTFAIRNGKMFIKVYCPQMISL